MLDINDIREELSELRFRDGKREVFIGRISEMCEEESEPAIVEQLDQYEQVPHLTWVCIGSSSWHVAPDCDDQEQAKRRKVMSEPQNHSSPTGGMPETPAGRWVQPFAQFLKIQSASGFLLLTCTAIDAIKTRWQSAADQQVR